MNEEQHEELVSRVAKLESTADDFEDIAALFMSRYTKAKSKQKKYEKRIKALEKKIAELENKYCSYDCCKK